MTEKKKIFNFAVKWVRKFRNPSTTSEEIVCTMEMSEDCKALGFEMDQGHSFARKYGERTSFKTSELRKIINEVDDISVLGAAIHSRWRYFNHWADYTEDILDPENREWFLLALGRLAVLAQGKIKKLRLVSNNTCFFSALDDIGKEIEQHITINSDGMVWFSAYNQQPGASHEKRRSKNWKIEESIATVVLENISKFFASQYDEIFAEDAGDWSLELTNTEGIVYKYKGFLCLNPKIEEQKLSGLLREALGMEDLFAFGYDSDRVERVSVDYCRVSKSEPGSRNAMTYTEKLVVDRGSGTLEYIQQSEDSQISRKYRVAEKIESILDDLEKDVLFGKIEGNPKDVVNDPLEAKDYTITVDFRHASQRVISGTFDKKALPDNWENFAHKVKALIELYCSGDLLNPALYDKIKRRIQEYVYCSVVFEGGYKRYYYIANDDINVDDYVLVPVGTDNHSSIAKVVKTENFEPAKVPLPIEKTKHIIRKCTDEDLTCF